MENWVQHRERYADLLRNRAQASGSKADIAHWEQYVRKTARMQAAQAHLSSLLGSDYAVVSGLRVSHQGQEIYLEHLVVGPTGIFLVESTEGDDPLWRQDLVQNLEFFRGAMGNHALFFTCLVVSRSAMQNPLPHGAHLVDSLEVAVDVIRDQRGGVTLPLALAQEIWHLIRAMEVRAPIVEAALPQRPIDRLEMAALGLPVFYSLVLAFVDGSFGAAFMTGLTFFGVPTVLSWLPIRKIEQVSIRRGWWIIILVIQVLFFWIMFSVLRGRTTQS